MCYYNRKKLFEVLDRSWNSFLKKKYGFQVGEMPSLFDSTMREGENEFSEELSFILNWEVLREFFVWYDLPVSRFIIMILMMIIIIIMIIVIIIITKTIIIIQIKIKMMIIIKVLFKSFYPPNPWKLFVGTVIPRRCLALLTCFQK